MIKDWVLSSFHHYFSFVFDEFLDHRRHYRLSTFIFFSQYFWMIFLVMNYTTFLEYLLSVPHSIFYRFLRGRCPVSNCPFSHVIDPDKMPVCSHFVRASCTRDNCPYRHVRVNPNAPICPEFLQGHCTLGEEVLKCWFVSLSDLFFIFFPFWTPCSCVC